MKDAVTSRHAAMFYSRFKRGKDTSNYSSDDLACILGGRDKRPKRLTEEEEEAQMEVTTEKVRKREGLFKKGKRVKKKKAEGGKKRRKQKERKQECREGTNSRGARKKVKCVEFV